jgi:hypothetical protein
LGNSPEGGKNVSAWSIGRRAAVRTAGPKWGEYVGRVVRWIPGDIIALYGAAVVAFEGPGRPDNPSLAWLFVFWIGTPIVVVLSGWVSGKVRLVAVVLSIFAFGIWSLAVPNSGWHAFDFVRNSPVGVGVAAALSGIVFGLVASKVDPET